MRLKLLAVGEGAADCAENSNARRGVDVPAGKINQLNVLARAHRVKGAQRGRCDGLIAVHYERGEEENVEDLRRQGMSQDERKHTGHESR